MSSEPTPRVPSPPAAVPPNRGRLLAKLLTLSAALVLGLLGIEGGFRLFGDVTDVNFYFWDPAIGPRVAPNQSGVYKKGRDVGGRFHYNAQGWNDPEDFQIVKPKGAFRVCLVGDSQVESLQVDPQDTMFAVAERVMRDDGVQAQWYAFGVSGFGTSEEHEVIRRYALDYHPDVVILLFVNNDPTDTSPYITDLEPFYVHHYLDKNGDLVMIPPKPWHPIWWRRLAARSAVVRYFMIQMDILGRIRSWRQRQHPVGGMPVREGEGTYKKAIVPELAGMSWEERGEATWKLIGKLLESARDECRRRGALFAVAYRGWGDEMDAPIHPEAAALPPKSADPYCLGPRAREMGREWLAPIARRLDIPYLDFTKAVQAEVARTGKSHRFPHDNHFSRVGHAAAGRALASWVEALRQDSHAGATGARP